MEGAHDNSKLGQKKEKNYRKSQLSILHRKLPWLWYPEIGGVETFKLNEVWDIDITLNWTLHYLKVTGGLSLAWE